MKTASIIFLAGFLGVWAQPVEADSCSNARPIVPLDVVVQPEQPTGPGQVVILSHDLERGPDVTGLKCGAAVGSLGFEIQAPDDDETPAEQLGYMVVMVEPADEFWRFASHLLDPNDPRPLKATDGWVWFNFDDMPEAPVSWTIRLAAVDEDGNQGEWSEPVEVTHKGMDFGCATAAGGESVGMVFLLFVGLWWRRRP